MARRSKTLRRLREYARFALDAFVLRRERPFLFILVINDKCNLSCFYCAGKNSGRYDLDYSSVKKELSAAYTRGCRALVITGGEPMLWRTPEGDIHNVVEMARELGFLDIAIFTNGTHNLDIEDATFIVTIDGTREVHNQIRSGSYDKIIANVKAAKSKAIASITITKANACCLEQAIREISETKVFEGITFNLLTQNPEVLAVHGFLGEERTKILDRMWRLKKSGYPIVLSGPGYKGLRENNWKRPIKQIELFAGGQLFTCCRDVVNPKICENCGYGSCAEISAALDFRVGAIWRMLKAK